MKKLAFLLLVVSMVAVAKAQEIYLATNATVSFFSATPVENIDATSNQAVGAINAKTRTVFFKVKMTTFNFKKALMQEHFNENYVESEKYPYATFNGVINEPVDLTVDGTYNVTVTGKLTVHGVEQPRTVDAVIVLKDGVMDVSSEYEVKVVDHEIKIPTVVVKNIAEVIKVKVNASMSPSRAASK